MTTVYPPPVEQEIPANSPYTENLASQNSTLKDNTAAVDYGTYNPIYTSSTDAEKLLEKNSSLQNELMIARNNLPHVYGLIPIEMQCPHCGKFIVTRVEKHNGIVPWLACMGFTMIGCWCGCCLIPFFVSSFKDTYHYCPLCSQLIGQRNKL